MPSVVNQTSFITNKDKGLPPLTSTKPLSLLTPAGLPAWGGYTHTLIAQPTDRPYDKFSPLAMQGCLTKKWYFSVRFALEMVRHGSSSVLRHRPCGHLSSDLSWFIHGPRFSAFFEVMITKLYQTPPNRVLKTRCGLVYFGY